MIILVVSLMTHHQRIFRILNGSFDTHVLVKPNKNIYILGAGTCNWVDYERVGCKSGNEGVE